MSSKVTFTILLMLIALTANTAELAPFTATYEVVKFNVPLGEIKVRLEAEENRFIYSKSSKTSGFAALFRDEKIKERSTLILSNNEIQVLEYDYQQRRGDKHRDTHFRFSSPDRVEGIFRNNPFSLTVPSGTLDRSSIELALMRDARPDTATLKYSLVEKGKLKSYTFQATGDQQIDTPAGSFQCSNYQIVRSSGKRSTTLCLAPDLNNLPVKITHNEKGTELYMLLKGYQF